MFPVENSFIIPGLDMTSVLYMLDHSLDARTVVVFSGVNWEAYQFLSNEGYFQQLFACRHPQLMAAGFSFPQLCAAHPTNCWKWLVCSSQEGVRVCAENKIFLKAVVPSLCSDLKERKAEADKQIRSICGSRNEDPESQIHKAWLSYKQAERDMHKMAKSLIENEKWLSANRALCLAHEGPELYAVTNFLKYWSWLFVPGGEERIFAEAARAQVPLRRDLSPCYLDWCSFHREDRDTTGRMDTHRADYYRLEENRQYWCKEQAFADREIALLQDPLKWAESVSVYEYEVKLEMEFNDSMAAEKQLAVVASCIRLIDQIQEGQLKPTPEVCLQIADLINSFSPRLQNHVWFELFQLVGFRLLDLELRAQRFSENFPQCLEKLRSILSSIPKEVFEVKYS